MLGLNTPPEGADVDALFVLLNKPPDADVLSLFFAAAPRKLNPLDAGVLAVLF